MPSARAITIEHPIGHIVRRVICRDNGGPAVDRGQRRPRFLVRPGARCTTARRVERKPATQEHGAACLSRICLCFPSAVRLRCRHLGPHDLFCGVRRTVSRLDHLFSRFALVVATCWLGDIPVRHTSRGIACCANNKRVQRPDCPVISAGRILAKTSYHTRASLAPLAAGTKDHRQTMARDFNRLELHGPYLAVGQSMLIKLEGDGVFITCRRLEL